MNVGKSTVSRCIVPSCKNRSDECPDKKFFTVPLKPEDRARWYKAVFQEDFLGTLSKSKNMHCCEDHFDMEKDTANYLQHLFVHSNLRLKKGIVPHRFINEVKKVPRNVLTKYRLQKPVGILRVTGAVLPKGSHNSSVDIPSNCEEGMQIKEEILDNIREENVASDYESSCGSNTDSEFSTIGQINELLLDDDTDDDYVFADFVMLLLRQIPSRRKRKRTKQMIRTILLEKIKEENDEQTAQRTKL